MASASESTSSASPGVYPVVCSDSSSLQLPTNSSHSSTASKIYSLFISGCIGVAVGLASAPVAGVLAGAAVLNIIYPRREAEIQAVIQVYETRATLSTALAKNLQAQTTNLTLDNIRLTEVINASEERRAKEKKENDDKLAKEKQAAEERLAKEQADRKASEERLAKAQADRKASEAILTAEAEILRAAVLRNTPTPKKDNENATSPNGEPPSPRLDAVEVVPVGRNESQPIQVKPSSWRRVAIEVALLATVFVSLIGSVFYLKSRVYTQM